MSPNNQVLKHMSQLGPFHIQTLTREEECRTGSQDNPEWVGPWILVPFYGGLRGDGGGQELWCNACWEFSLSYMCVEWGTMYAPVGRYACVCECTFTNICECEGQKMTLGVFIDWSLPYNLRQGLSIKHTDFTSQGSFGHSPASAYQVLDYRQVTVPVQHFYVCLEQTVVFLCMWQVHYMLSPLPSPSVLIYCLSIYKS